jgi:ATP-dependent Clp protease ATP-binding subunit ClpX
MVTVKHRDPSAVTEAHCSFCGKSQHSVAKVIAGPDGVYICNECVGLSNQVLEVEMAGEASEPLRSLLQRTAAAVRATRPALAAELEAAAAELEE